MINNIVHWVKPLTSLKLTVFCLGCAMILVFLGTLDQVNIGVYEAENRYFKSFFLYFTPPGTTLKIPWFPSGYLVGGGAFSEFDRGTPGAIQIELEKSGHPSPSLGRYPVTARSIVHRSVPGGKSDASGSRRDEKLFAELLSR
jgi:hypothetical protein